MALPENPGLRGPFSKGMNNRTEDFALRPDELRNAVNVDISTAGRISRRQGYELVHAAAGAHSLWADGDYLYYQQESTLYRVNARHASAPEAVHFGLHLDLPMAHVATPRGVFYSNGVDSGHLVGGAPRNWGIAPPPSTPNAAVTLGTLHPGLYQVTYTYVRADGEESGAPMSATVQLAATGGIELSGMAPSLDPTVTHARIYCTQQNGTESYQALQIPVSQLAQPVTITYQPEGRRLAPQPIVQMPPGDVLELHGSRVYSAIGCILNYSEEWAFGQFHPLRNFFAFPAPVTIVASTVDGLYVVADQTYFFSGFEPSKFAPNIVAPYGAVKGTKCVLPNSVDIGWFSARGAVLASPGGNLRALQDSQVAVETATIGAATFREEDGRRQILSTLLDPNVSQGAANSFMQAEVIRKETRL